jgi:hypothetical protein
MSSTPCGVSLVFFSVTGPWYSSTASGRHVGGSETRDTPTAPSPARPSQTPPHKLVLAWHRRPPHSLPNVSCPLQGKYMADMRVFWCQALTRWLRIKSVSVVIRICVCVFFWDVMSFWRVSANVTVRCILNKHYVPLSSKSLNLVTCYQ